MMNESEERLIRVANEIYDLEIYDLDDFDMGKLSALHNLLRAFLAAWNHPDVELERDFETIRDELISLRTERDALQGQVDLVRSYCERTPLGWGITNAEEILVVLGQETDEQKRERLRRTEERRAERRQKTYEAAMRGS